jgi:hypothetical protein
MSSDIEVRVCEVGLRDGLQLVSTFFPTEQKLAWIRLVFMLDSMGLNRHRHRKAARGARHRRPESSGTELYGAVGKPGLPTKYVSADARAG